MAQKGLLRRPWREQPNVGSADLVDIFGWYDGYRGGMRQYLKS